MGRESRLKQARAEIRGKVGEDVAAGQAARPATSNELAEGREVVRETFKAIEQRLVLRDVAGARVLLGRLQQPIDDLFAQAVSFATRDESTP